MLRDNGPSVVENKITQIAIGERCFVFELEESVCLAFGTMKNYRKVMR